MPPSAIPSDVTGSRKFKMAAAKPELLISPLLDKIGTPFQRLTPHFRGSGIQMALFRIRSDVIGSRKSKMAAVKPEVLISQLVDKIATPFQQLTPHFRGPGIQWRYSKYRPM